MHRLQQLPWAVLLLLPAAAAAALEVSLDLGWRVTPYQQPCTPFLALPPLTCLGPGSESWRAQNVSSAAQCTAAACAANSSAFSFNGSHCYIGDAATLYVHEAACAGAAAGVRDPSAWPPAAPPEAARAHDDGAWATVDLPHDASASAPRAFPGPAGPGFRLPVASFYRKHFALQADWEGSSLRITLRRHCQRLVGKRRAAGAAL